MLQQILMEIVIAYRGSISRRTKIRYLPPPIVSTIPPQIEIRQSSIDIAVSTPLPPSLSSDYEEEGSTEYKVVQPRDEVEGLREDEEVEPREHEEVVLRDEETRIDEEVEPMEDEEVELTYEESRKEEVESRGNIIYLLFYF